MIKTKEKIIPVSLEKEMKKSYIDYAMSVIVGRALPDVRDGLKPVHRRILYAMNESGMTYDKPYKKSARVVGEVLGKYHPHGDLAVYDTIVRMVQDFSLRYPLIDGQGNFGSIDNDPAAAARYTEVRLAKIASELLVDIEKDTVDFAQNYDESLYEPIVLPAKLPNLLINGSTGIAVGMATNIPPHNLKEVIHACIKGLDYPDVSISELMKIIKGPDFPTGGCIYGLSGIKSAYTTGKGLIKLRAKAEIAKGRSKDRIIITEIPYQVNKAKLIEDIANLVKDKKISDISGLRDESDKDGIRVVIDLKQNANSSVILNQLYKNTQMETTFGIINIALVDGEPKILNLKDMITLFLEHRKEVILRRTKFDLDKAERRAHILEGFKIALKNIDSIISKIKSSKTYNDASKALIDSFNLSKVQTKAILELRLNRLTRLEQERIETEHKNLTETISYLKEVLSDPKKLNSIIKKELLDLEKYYDDRRTEIIAESTELEIEDLISDEDVVITITNSGYIKRIPVSEYRRQRRGGKGVIGIRFREGLNRQTKTEDFVEGLFIASTLDNILFFTDKGKVYSLKGYEIPTGSKSSRGKAIVNLINLSNEKITATVPVATRQKYKYLIFVTKRGIVKRVSLDAFSNIRKTGIRALDLLDDDELRKVKLINGNEEVIIATKNGKAIRFKATDVRDMGRNARGVKGITLMDNDEVVGMDIITYGSLLTITENGYGKRTDFSEYRITKRGGKGIKNIITNARNGLVVGIKSVTDNDEIMITSSHGKVIRVPVNTIRVQGRNTQGVKIMDLEEFDKVVSIAKLVPDKL
ncbi:MAG TPA: DNA gyrase subunit A [Methanosarcinales archaeon]|nr:DNA gyrase subunit A [Methanosarcinales archaeon]